MEKPLLGQKIAFLVANGFYEDDMVQSQRALQALGANIRVISMDRGLVNSWNGEGWGLHFAADNALNTALAADYDMLVVPGGRRSIDKLKLTAHTGRFMGGFLGAGKPVAIFGSALELLVFFEKAPGYEVAGPARLQGDAERAGALWEGHGPVISGSLLSAFVMDDNREEFVAEICRHFSASLAKAGTEMGRAA